MTTDDFFVLNNGIKMPCRGLGVFQNKNPETCEQSILCAINRGYRMIDTAAVYGNEEAVGRAIKNCGVPRGQLFITTKLWYADCSRDRAKRALDRSLKKLGLDYVDLYLIHEPYGWIKSAWRGLEESVEEGKVRAIGVSNFGMAELKKLLVQANIAPAVDQIELHPYFQRAELVGFLRQNGILAEAWAPFAEGKRGIFTHPVLTDIAKKHGCTVAQLILAWLHARGIAVIPKSVRPERIAENFDFLGISPDEEDMRAVAALDGGESLFPWDRGWRRPMRKIMGFFHTGF